jgi:hypothetical protein
MRDEDFFVVWCKKEQDILLGEIERLESGRIRTYSRSGTDFTETTSATILKLKAKLAEMDTLLTKLDVLP